ncbi:protein PSK SIMULATOR 1-like [Typha angustifolia]|uniref:protein PSK SIMULATOR 1-like n=1 Tax=Typha angustifolia TaxID=59011 RepID=UPI003C2BF153
MVVPKSWLSSQIGSDLIPGRDLRPDDTPLGILAFEAAAAMSRLVSLHFSMSDREILKLRSDTMRSQGVAYLNSTDQALLLRLACYELMDDLDRAAASISRVGSRCRGNLTRNFARHYTDLKAGSADLDLLGIRLTKKGIERRVKKMEKYIAVTAKLFAEVEVMDELEATERKMVERWTRYSGPIPLQKDTILGSDSFRLELKSQRHKVKRLKDESLWAQGFDKAVGLMAESAFAVFARICVVFGPFVPGLPPVLVTDRIRVRFTQAHLKLRLYPKFSSGPIEKKRVAVDIPMRNSCPIFGAKASDKPDMNWTKALEAHPDTVGVAGMALRYANVILSAEKLLQSGVEECAEREDVYEMLPAGLRSTVRSKLRDSWRNRGPLDGSLAEGWKEAVARILAWLGPMAHDTIRWQEERNMDRRMRFQTNPRALMIQTLHLSDREKTEAAIAEVLVGLSCVCWYEERLRGSLRY